jgi:flavin-dependent dehydrogenase
MTAIESVQATTTLRAAAEVAWDVLVVGGGPAGAIAAHGLARRGVRVGLLDRMRFPRGKVCGCCLNGAALSVLDQCGLTQLPGACGAVKLREFILSGGGRSASVALRHGVSLSRERFDAELIKAAIGQGVVFLDDSRAAIEATCSDVCQLNVCTATSSQRLQAKTVVWAAGLGSRTVDRVNGRGGAVASSSRIGAGTVLNDACDQYVAGTIYMACHRNGYAGLVRLEDDRLDIAAALDVTAVKRRTGIGNLVAEILDSSGLRLPRTLADATWRGTPLLTQQPSRIFGHRYFVVGDAAGYVEPFTGEGMAWAMAAGRAVVPLVLQSLESGTEQTGPAWQREHRRLIGRRMRRCRAISRLLRRPLLVNSAIRLLAHAPSLASPFVGSLNKSMAYLDN